MHDDIPQTLFLGIKFASNLNGQQSGGMVQVHPLEGIIKARLYYKKQDLFVYRKVFLL